MLGNIKFIGELGKLEMLHDSILHRCAEQLLVGRRKQSLIDQMEDIECLAHLMKTCGRLLDHVKAKTRMDQYFERIRAIIANPEMPTRIKFLLQDVIEMRNNRWMPRKLATPDGPRTIQQVREDAARDGCIYLPQQDMEPRKPTVQQQTQLQAAIFSKGRAKGMEDIFGGPSDMGMALSTGPGIIGAEGTFGGRGGASSFVGGFEGARPSFEEKFRETNSNYNNSNQRERGSEGFKKRDNFESKFAERPDFGDRFTANRNKTHPANRGGRGGAEGEMRRSPGYENSRPQGNGFGDREVPPRFSQGGRQQFGDRDRDSGPLRPSAASMMLKPKTPFSLPKSAVPRLDGVNGVPGKINGTVMMTSNEPAVIIQKAGSNNKKAMERKNQGPTREEVFGKIDGIMEKLAENQSTNEAFTSWKEARIPDKMVNNALIHLFKQMVKMEEPERRALVHQVVDQLATSEMVTAVQIKESLARLVDRLDEALTLPTADLAAWSIASDKLKVAEVAEMTEGGATHPLFLAVLQALATKEGEQETLRRFRESGVKLPAQLPLALRTEEQLGQELESRGLAFLVPLLAIKADLQKQLEQEDTRQPAVFLAWIKKNIPMEQQADGGFTSALLGEVVKYISEATTLAGEGSTEKEATDQEKELIASFKDVLAPFLTTQELQLAAVYSLQVFCFSRGFPKGLLLRWFVALYEADVVEEHVFLKWKEDVNDSYPGKGKALFQVTIQNENLSIYFVT